MRVRQFTQDDAHVFCTDEQIAPETARFVALLSSIYRDFGFDSFRVKFSDRPTPRAGNEADWDRAEAALREACRLADIEYELNPGEGAFYGPKLEFVLRDAIGGTGSAAPCRSTTCCPSGSTPNMSARTAPGTGR